jgi:hypothetical protein
VIESGSPHIIFTRHHSLDAVRGLAHAGSLSIRAFQPFTHYHDRRPQDSALKTYSVAGKTLADIHKDIQKKGPVDPNEGKRYAGSCLG